MEGCFTPRARGCSQRSLLYRAGWMGPGTDCLLSVCALRQGLNGNFLPSPCGFFPLFSEQTLQMTKLGPTCGDAAFRMYECIGIWSPFVAV